MTDTNCDFFRWTRDKQGAFSKTLKDELDKKMPMSGGIMTGPLDIDFNTTRLTTEDILSFRVKYGETGTKYSWSWSVVSYSPISYFMYNNTKLFGVCYNLGLFPALPSSNKQFTLGYFGNRWPNVYTNKLNNGGDIEIPEKAGTMALLSDIEDVLRKYNLIPPQSEPEATEHDGQN